MGAISRRDLLKRAGLAGAGALVGARVSQAQRDAILVAGQPVEIVVTPASPVTARITIVPLVNGAPAGRMNGSLVNRLWPAPAARLRSISGSSVVRCGDLRVAVDGLERPAFRIAIATANGRAVQQLGIDRQTGGLTFALGDRPILGLGEGGPQFDRRGSVVTARSGQGGYRLRTHGGRVPVQWLIGTGGWAMFVHQPLGAFDLSGAEGRLVVSPPRAEGDPADGASLDLFVVGAREPAAIMAEYARLTGHPEMPPLWAFGYQQSHRTLASRDEILQEAKAFREKKLPCETLIYLGTGFCPSGWNTDNGEFTFNSNVFPDPPAMIRQLHDDHFKVVLHVVLEGRTLDGAVTDRCTAPPLPSGRTKDGKWPDDRQTSCYWPVHKPLVDAGVDGFWPDQGDGLDAPSRLARIRMYWEGSQEWRPNQRVFALHRNGHSGMQRYGAFLWSGDVYSTWETLKTHVPVAVNTALSGIPFWGTDIGGFVPTKEFTGELYVRWFQFGAFCPLFRSHGRTWTLRLPWGWNTGSLEPDEIAGYTGGAANPDPTELHNAAVEPICRKYLDLRARLMPYLYSAVREAHQTGLPIVRALWLHYPSDGIAVARGDQYLWGRDILVAPVVEKGAASRSVYLPAGRWYDFWTETTHDGGRDLTREVDLETMPLFVRAGAIVPTDPVRQYTGEPVNGPRSVTVYPGADGAFTLYEDDGQTFDYRRGDWMGVDLLWRDTARRLTLRLSDGSRMRAPMSRRFAVRVAGFRTVRDIAFTGSAIEVRL